MGAAIIAGWIGASLGFAFGLIVAALFAGARDEAPTPPIAVVDGERVVALHRAQGVRSDAPGNPAA